MLIRLLIILVEGVVLADASLLDIHLFIVTVFEVHPIEVIKKLLIDRDLLDFLALWKLFHFHF